MIGYVSHRFNGFMDDITDAQNVCLALSLTHPKDTFVSPVVALSHIFDNDLIPEQEKLEQRSDLLSICDQLIVAGEVDNITQKEIEYAEMFGMEVFYI